MLQADILIKAAGVLAFITGDMVKQEVIAIDLGGRLAEGPGDRQTPDCGRPGLRKRGGRRAEATTSVAGSMGAVTEVWLADNNPAAPNGRQGRASFRDQSVTVSDGRSEGGRP